ncbi:MULTISPECIES: DUF4254 domain-containing protein [Maribacter]|uniref:DUF4254 domain-containing protein n=1 Tax=Maribacter flavus TaxID=1658664 RepID=A0ABU7IEE4_9FLAO|nr:MULTISPECIES: DUF4254 domain-containing protein [Maribacter]MDC6404171.1 DUF4254 domain-containing protein [Maribacter sp. PR66]MEE1971314.1 DUF4254 domain-containing protein [Maribacter flavus]
MFSDFAIKVFEESIEKYHEKDDVYQVFENPYPKNDIAHLLYRKNWIDTVQWHYEDIIRNPQIEPPQALDLKRKIDASNQDRTDLVEYIDSYFLDKYRSVEIKQNATINTESPAWAVDRLSILALKIYHMQEEVNRKDASQEHLKKCQEKLDILLEQRRDLSTAIDQLLKDIEEGNKYMKVYKQMKMYNDEELNPILRGQK